MDELDEVVGLLATSPHAGIAYEAYKARPLRRLFLPGSGYHVYYAIDERRARVTVRALWQSTAPGRDEHDKGVSHENEDDREGVNYDIAPPRGQVERWCRA